MLMGSIAQTQQILVELLWSIISLFFLLLDRQVWMFVLKGWRRGLRGYERSTFYGVYYGGSMHGSLADITPYVSRPGWFCPLLLSEILALIRTEVGEVVLFYLSSGNSLEAINDTNIVLIPKCKTLNKVTDYRPISLCNVIYKIVSKVLANRLKNVLPLIISPNQSAFLAGRLISDNIIAAYKTLHTMNNMKGKHNFMALKLDMSKAYDLVEWAFVVEVMRRLGFGRQWLQLIMKCISLVSYSILINGEPHGRITPTRGICQGDPLSLYLFIFYAKALSSML